MGNLVREFFRVNHTIILFVYGEAFFVLGLAIALQSWKHSRLSLARALPWLSAFGFAHGLHEWGHLFIPIQSAYLPPQIINSLVVFQAILLALSFSLLFQFGLEMLRPLPDRARLLRYLPLALFVVWLWYSFGFADRTAGNITTWYTHVSIVARYTIGIAGAMVAAYGLHRQRQDLKRTCRPPKSVLRSLDSATISLLGYSILGGIFVSPAGFSPASRLNSDLVYSVTWVPVEVWRGLLGLVLAGSIIRAFELFRIEIDRRMGDMEERQVLLSERDRIARELHDITLQSVYAAGLLLRAAENEIGKAGSQLGMKQIQEGIRLLDSTIDSIRSYIGDLRPPPTAQSLKSGVRALVEESPIRALVDVETHLDVPDDRNLSPIQIGHLLAIVNEALSNVARHANAKHVGVSVTGDAKCLCVEVSDDGDGLPSDYVVGYGLRNMQERTRILGGSLTITSYPKRGTKVRVEIPWEESREAPTSVSGR